MFVVLGFFKRKPGMTHKAFSAYWRDVHGPMIRNHPGEALASISSTPFQQVQ